MSVRRFTLSSRSAMRRSCSASSGVSFLPAMRRDRSETMTWAMRSGRPTRNRIQTPTMSRTRPRVGQERGELWEKGHDEPCLNAGGETAGHCMELACSGLDQIRGDRYISGGAAALDAARVTRARDRCRSFYALALRTKSCEGRASVRGMRARAAWDWRSLPVLSACDRWRWIEKGPDLGSVRTIGEGCWRVLSRKMRNAPDRREIVWR